MAKIQEELANTAVEATAGGGAVTVTVTGSQKVLSIKIKPEAVDPEDLTLLEDLIMAALNEAMEKSQKLAGSRLGALTGGMKIPGLF